MTSPYSHSIRNRLFLVLGCDELEFTVTDNALKTLLSGKSAVTDNQMLTSVLASTAPLAEIFSSVSLTWVGNPFLCYPTLFTDSKDQEKLFITSHKLRPQDKLLNGKLNTEISISYAVDQNMFTTIKDKYPNVVYQHEVEPFFSYIQTELKPSQTSLILSRTDQKLLLIALDAKALKLLNQYDVKDINDVFYFTMLAIERLELDIEHLELFWINSPDAQSFEEVKTLFANYIAKITDVPVSNSASTAMATTITCA
ncbi:MAG: hypothetical protein ACI9JN_002002 [Bacteroidia bacterium]